LAMRCLAMRCLAGRRTTIIILNCTTDISRAAVQPLSKQLAYLTRAERICSVNPTMKRKLCRVARRKYDSSLVL